MVTPIETMKYYFTGIQHIVENGEYREESIPISVFDAVDEYKAHYNEEWANAYADKNCVGLTVVVFDSTGVMVFNDHWMREIEEDTSEIQAENTKS